MKLFLFKIFTTWHRKRIIFVFCYSFNILLFSKNQIRLLWQTRKTFSIAKLALCPHWLCLLLHNNFLVFNSSGNCRKSSHNLWTLPNHNSWSFEGLGFQVCYSASTQSLTAVAVDYIALNDLGKLKRKMAIRAINYQESNQ